MPEVTTPSSKPRPPVEVAYATPRRTLRRRLSWEVRAWARSTFSRESFISSFKSLLWVGPLTILIWIYAEREQVVTLNNVPVTLDVRGNEPGRVVRLVSPAGGTVHVELKGPQAEMDRVKEWLETTNVPIDIDHNLSPDVEHPVEIAAQLNQLPRVKSNGVTVTSCVPAEIRVVIDPIKEWEADVKIRPEDARTLSGPQVFSPAKVKMSAPRSAYDRAMRQAASQGQPLVAYANLDPFKQQLVEPGKHTLSSVAVVPSVRIDDANVTVSPTTVSADIIVKDEAEKTITLPYVRVLAAYPLTAQADQYKAVYERTIPNVNVSGPEPQIAMLTEQRFIPTAIFEVNYTGIDPAVETPAPAALMFQLPPGVHVSEQDSQRKITYTLKPRTLEPQ